MSTVFLKEGSKAFRREVCFLAHLSPHLFLLWLGKNLLLQSDTCTEALSRLNIRMYNRAESALSCHSEGMKKFYTHTSLDLFPCPSCKCSSLITHSFRVFSADSASIKSLSFLYYAPLSPLPVTTAIRFAPLTSPQIYFTSSTAFSKELWLFVIEECLIHFKSTNICLIFWARF